MLSKTTIILGIIIALSLYQARQNKVNKLIETDDIQKKHISKGLTNAEINENIYNIKPREYNNQFI